MPSNNCVGLLTMRAGGEDERETEHLAAIVADLDLLPARERDREVRRGPGNFGGPAVERKVAASEEPECDSVDARIVEI